MAKCTKTAFNNYYACSLRYPCNDQPPFQSIRIHIYRIEINVGDAFSFAIYKTPPHISVILCASNINKNVKNVAYNNKINSFPYKIFLKKLLDISEFHLESGVYWAQYFTQCRGVSNAQYICNIICVELYLDSKR